MSFNDDALYHIIRNGMRMTVKGIELRNTDIVEYVEVPDSREILERDIREFLTDGGRMAIKSGELKAIEGFLDRQVGITKRKMFRHYRSELERRTEREYKLQAEIDKRDKGIARLKTRRDALQEQVDELQEQVMEKHYKLKDANEANQRQSEKIKGLCRVNDEQQQRVDKLTVELEAAHAKNRQLKAHISSMQDGRHGWHVEADKLRQRVGKLESENIELKAERDRYRELASELLDAAHNMQLIADRGLA